MTITLSAAKRGEEKIDSLRANGKVPAVVYGPVQEPMAISLEAKEFGKVLKEAGESTIIELTGLDKPTEVLVKDVVFDPVKQQITHVDLYAIEAGKEMTTHVVLTFVGEAPVEHARAGVVNKVLHEVAVTCQPNDLPNHIDVDISNLKTIEDKVLVKDLQVPTGVTIEADPEDPVVVVSIAKEETEEVEAISMDAIEVEKKGKQAEAGTTEA